jgi:SAM-dependent methyltransferase
MTISSFPRRVFRVVRRVSRRVLARPQAAKPPTGLVPPPREVVVDVRPPAIADPMAAGRSVADHPSPAGPFDIDLFESLNVEYATRPISPTPPAYDHDTLVNRSIARVQRIHHAIDLADKRVLVFGCGNGYEVWFLSHAFGSEAWGIDVVERGAWAVLGDERTRFVLGDVAREQRFEQGMFDRILSINTFEHVTQPIATLEALFESLRPGGLAWISANLYRGPLASHRYREVTFPWPHLLFEDDVFREFYRRRGLPEQGAEWVNRLTWEQYRVEMERIGFRIERERLLTRPIDQPFYERFEFILGRYPRADLERDFFEVVLRKPGQGRSLREPAIVRSAPAGRGAAW